MRLTVDQREHRLLALLLGDRDGRLDLAGLGYRLARNLKDGSQVDRPLLRVIVDSSGILR